MFEFIPLGYDEEELFSYLDSMEKNLLEEIASPFTSFRTDVVDKGDAYHLRAELPGFTREEIQMEADDHFLHITARKKDTVLEEETENYIRKERRSGTFTRSFPMDNIKTEQITAKYEKGILEVHMPKKEKQPVYIRKIDIQ